MMGITRSTYESKISKAYIHENLQMINDLSLLGRLHQHINFILHAYHIHVEMMREWVESFFVRRLTENEMVILVVKFSIKF